MTSSHPEDGFTIERRGDALIIVPTPRLEDFDLTSSDAVSNLLLSAIADDSMPQVIVDLEGVDYFGSSFLSLLLRCWKSVLVKGGQMVLAGVSPRARELLRITSLDIVWPIYKDRAEALGALEAD